MKLSIVIPIYNVCATLDRCVASVVGQDYADKEIILVDDGSTDGSGDMADAWEERSKDIMVVHKANGGLSDARNCGIAHATGELVTFVDSDDFLAPHTYSSVVSEMSEGVDILEYAILLHSGRQGMEERKGWPCTTYSSKDDYWFAGKAYAHTYACNKIFRKTLFEDVRFPVGKVFEDAHTLPLLLAKTRKVQTTGTGLYHYCDNPRGITATASGRDLLSLLHAHVDHWAYWEDAEYYLHLVNIQLDVCRLTGASPMLKNRRIWKLKGLPARLLLKALLINLLGLDTLCTIYKKRPTLKGHS